MKLRTGIQTTAQVLLVALLSQTVVKAGPPTGLPLQHFVCSTGYNLTECQAEMAVLRKTLAKYPATELGEWTWVLVRSADWKHFLMLHGIDPDSPAVYIPSEERDIHRGGAGC